jgi:cell division protein FtsL
VGNVARKYQTQESVNHQPKQTVQTKVRQKVGITKGEKLLGALFITFICVMAVQLIQAQADIYAVNKEIQDVQKAIQEQEKQNEQLQLQVNELSTYERIWQKAKELGLDLNENNVKVVQKK